MRQTYLIIGLTQLSVNLALEYGTLSMRRGLLQHVLVRSLATVIYFALLLLIRENGLVGSYFVRCLITFPFFFACQWLSTDTVAQKTFLYFMDFSVTTAVSTLSLWIFDRLPAESFRSLAASLSYVLVMALFVLLYFTRLRVRVRQMLFLFRRANPLYAAFPVLSFAFFAIVYAPMRIDSSLGWFITMMLFIGLTVLTYSMLFSHFTTVYNGLQAESSIALATRQLWLQKKYYAEIARSLGTQSQLLSDERYHLLAMRAMAEAGDFSSLAAYVRGVLHRYGAPKVATLCENSVVNAVISGYVALAEKRGISVSTNLYVPADIRIDEYELCSFFGNALENAIEACERIQTAKGAASREGRFISISTLIDAGRFIVRVENSFQDDPERQDPTFPSEKGSGIGLESMRAVVEHYQGSLSCERRGAVFVLSAVFCVVALT